MSQIVRRLLGVGLSLGLPLGALAMVLLGLPPTAQASSIVVNTCNAAHLSDAIAAAGDGDVITFACSPGTHTIVVTQTQVLDHDLTIDGGHVITLSGGNAVRILGVATGHTVTLENLTFRNGYASQGGAVRTFGSVVIHASSFISNGANNNSTAGGGALYVTDTGRAVVVNSFFDSNSVALAGGQGGAIYSSGVLTTVNTLFERNYASVGGAVSQNGGRAYLYNSTFLSNTALYGGAVVAYNNLVVVFGDFEHNKTVGIPVDLQAPAFISLTLGGGALNVASGSVAIDHTGFVFNAAANGPAGAGGAIVNSGQLGIVDSELEHNQANTGGGAIINDGNLGLARTNLTDNDALGAGGAISNTGSLVLETSLLAGNTAGTAGGAVDNHGTASTAVNLFYKNEAPTGGAMRNSDGGRLFVNATTFEQNDALTSNGAALLNSGTLTVTNSTIIGNSSASNGAAVYSGGVSSARTLLNNSTVVSNAAVSGISGLRVTSGVFSVTNSLVAGNQPTNCSITPADGGHNLQFGDTSCGPGFLLANPHIGSLADNGGQTFGFSGIAVQTVALLPGSPAINAGNPASCTARDERGYLRLAPCDIGAFEVVFPLMLPLLMR